MIDADLRFSHHGDGDGTVGALTRWLQGKCRPWCGMVGGSVGTVARRALPTQILAGFQEP